jgi:hypothetical protein
LEPLCALQVQELHLRSGIHLALHGYADLDYPDRSALVFAPDPSGSEDGLLRKRPDYPLTDQNAKFFRISISALRIIRPIELSMLHISVSAVPTYGGEGDGSN